MKMYENPRLKPRKDIVDQAIDIAAGHGDVAGVDKEHIVASKIGKLDGIDLIDGRGVMFYRKTVKIRSWYGIHAKVTGQ